MTRDEAQATVRDAERHVGGRLDLTVISFDCPGGYAVVSPVREHTGLWYLLTEYSVNIFEELQAIAAAPPIVQLALGTVQTPPEVPPH